MQTRYTAEKCEEKQHGKIKKLLRQLLIKARTRDARIRNNQMFEEDERDTADKKEYKRTVPSID